VTRLTFAERKAQRVWRGGRKGTTWEERKAAIRAKAQRNYERRVAAGDLTEKDFVWCEHCERVWYRRNRKTWCPGEGCDGGGRKDLVEWGWLRRVNPGYPEVPVPGEEYAMYS